MKLLTRPFFATGIKLAFVSALLTGISPALRADTPLGWISADHLSAYTVDSGAFDVSVSALAVNETVDFLDIREDLLAGTRQLGGDSGDLVGNRAEVQFGVTSFLSVFYREQQQDLTVDIGEVSSINLISIDNALKTKSIAYGLKWNIYESGYQDNSRSWRAASLEISRTENTTNDFTGTLDRISLGEGLVITFGEPRTFRLQDLDDEGWQARFLYSFPLGDQLTTTVWAGYAENKSSSGTGSDIPSLALAPAFEQSIATDEDQVLVGAGLNWQITPRMPLQLTYEYIMINDSETELVTNPSNALLPSFLRASNISTVEADSNHTLRGNLSYWITPRINLGLTAKLFSNQFLGVVPHYNNPLSSSFADAPYGYVGVNLGIKL